MYKQVLLETFIALLSNMDISPTDIATKRATDYSTQWTAINATIISTI